MTLDTRARRAMQGIRRAVEVMEMSTTTNEPRKVERFDRFRDRKQRNRRIGAILVAATLTIATIVLATNVLQRRDTKVPVTPPSMKDMIVFGEQGRHGIDLFTMNLDGTDVRALSVQGDCPSWAPDGSKILIPQQGRTGGLATINPDGSGYTRLFPAETIGSEGCAAFSPDGTRIVGPAGPSASDTYNGLGGERGISTVRVSDGGDLVRLTDFGGSVDSSYSPDGTQVVFSRNVVGGHYVGNRFVHPTPGLFVVNADGTGLHPIATKMAADGTPSWSPDGRWILFSIGTSRGSVYVVHPDGSGLRRIVLETVPRLRRAISPSWSPDGTRFVFVGWSGSDRFNLYTARRDGTDVEQITHTRGIIYVSPDWGTSAG